jgi:Flp pilus assembly pilin Flp
MRRSAKEGKEIAPPRHAEHMWRESMHFTTDDRGASIAEAIAYTLIALVAAGAAVWGVFNAVAGRFNAIASGL